MARLQHAPVILLFFLMVSLTAADEPCADIGNCLELPDKVCLDYHVATFLCRRYCGFCTSTTAQTTTQMSSTSPSGCVDNAGPNHCHELGDEKLAKLCSDYHMAFKFCQQSCGYCGSSLAPPTTPTTTSKPPIGASIEATPSPTGPATSTAVLTSALTQALTTQALTTQSPTTQTPTTQAPTTQAPTTQAPKTQAPTTQAPTTTATTTPAPRTPNIPHNSPVSCAVCDGEPEYCEMLYVPLTCNPPNNYCINHVENHKDGSRTINRTCGNFETCYLDWYEGSSDKEFCQNFQESSVFTHNFECTYCCLQDDCNASLKPSDNTLYREV